MPKNYANQDHYEVLGVARTSTHDQIRKAYRKLCKTHHTDTATDKDAAHEMMVQINEAWGVLGDKDKRARWDRWNSSGSSTNSAQSAQAQAEARAREAQARQQEAEQRAREEEERKNAQLKKDFAAAFKKWDAGTFGAFGAEALYKTFYGKGGAEAVKEQTKLYNDMHALWEKLNDLGLKEYSQRYKKCSNFYNEKRGYSDQFAFESDFAHVPVDKKRFANIYMQEGEAGINASIPRLQKLLERHEEIIKNTVVKVESVTIGSQTFKPRRRPGESHVDQLLREKAEERAHGAYKGAGMSRGM